MPTSATLLAFGAATLAILVIPGPSVVHVVSRTLEHGRRAGFFSMLGLETGALLHVVAAASGLGLVLSSSELAFSFVRYGGAGFLLALGAQQLRRQRQAAHVLSAERGTLSRRRLFGDGVLVDLLNPKTAIFFLAFLSQFVDPSRGPVSHQVAVLGLCFVLLAACCDSAYVLLSGALGRNVQRSPRLRTYVGRATGGVYLGLGALTAVA